MSTPVRFLLPSHIHDEMLKQARAELPNECCGVLAGKPAVDGVCRVEKYYPLINVAENPQKEYWSEAKGMLAAEKDMRKHDIDIVAVFHSHPTSHAVPSKTDRERNYWETVANFILSLESEPPVLRCWWLTAEEYSEAKWEMAER